MKLGYIGIDQYGNYIKIDKHPRKELMEHYGYRSAQKMYRDTKDGKAQHVGYVIGPYWLNIYEVHDWKGGVK